MSAIEILGSAQTGVTNPKKSPASKQAAVVNDRLVPMPSQHVRAAVLRHQGQVPADHVLVRDHNSEHDPVIADDALVDLSLGNVFYSVPRCEAPGNEACDEPAKLAFMVDDRWEVVVVPRQTGRSIRDLFNLSQELELLRDFESPDDDPVEDATEIHFKEGPVFRTRKHEAKLVILVNRLRFTEKTGVKHQMKGREIAQLVEPDPSQTKVQRLAPNPKDIGLDETIEVECGDSFKVIRCNINAGFQSERIASELARLQALGARVTFLPGPTPAVIYHDVPVGPGLPVPATDVLVKIPAGYPGGIIDNAFLPEGSPLLSCTRGGEQHVETIAGRPWKQKSIHPHTGNGIPWDKNRHGFHTYYNEMVSWLDAR